MTFRCGHGLFNQQGTISIQMLGYILMVTVCAGKDRKFRSRQLLNEMEQLCEMHKINWQMLTYYQLKHSITKKGLFLKCPFAVLHLCSKATEEQKENIFLHGALNQTHIWYLAVF